MITLYIDGMLGAADISRNSFVQTMQDLEMPEEMIESVALKFETYMLRDILDHIRSRDRDEGETISKELLLD